MAPITTNPKASADKPMTFWAAVSLGIGAMIGAGIFALLGEAGAIAGDYWHHVLRL